MGHFYDRTGKPVYEVPMSTKEGMRNTTIKDARKLRLTPSVTTITGVLDKAGLLRYYLQQIVKAAIDPTGVKQKENEEFEKYVDRLSLVAKQESEKARNLGSYYHDCLEQYFKGRPLDGLNGYTEKDKSFIRPVIEAVNMIDKDISGEPNSTEFEAESSFAHELGFGGKVDLIGFSRMALQDIIIDFKGKNAEDPDKFYVYEEHLMQLAAYRLGLKSPKARCYNIMFSVNKPNIIKVHEWSDEELQRGEAQFKCLLKYWQLSNGYDSSFTENENEENKENTQR